MAFLAGLCPLPNGLGELARGSEVSRHTPWVRVTFSPGPRSPWLVSGSYPGPAASSHEDSSLSVQGQL